MTIKTTIITIVTTTTPTIITNRQGREHSFGTGAWLAPDSSDLT